MDSLCLNSRTFVLQNKFILNLNQNFIAFIPSVKILNRSSKSVKITVFLHSMSVHLCSFHAGGLSGNVY